MILSFIIAFYKVLVEWIQSVQSKKVWVKIRGYFLQRVVPWREQQQHYIS